MVVNPARNPVPFEKNDEEFPYCVSYYMGIKITEENASQAKLLRLKEVDLENVVKSFLDNVELHQFIPEYLNTRIRIVDKMELEGSKKTSVTTDLPVKQVKEKEVKKILLKEKIPKI